MILQSFSDSNPKSEGSQFWGGMRLAANTAQTQDKCTVTEAGHSQTPGPEKVPPYFTDIHCEEEFFLN